MLDETLPEISLKTSSEHNNIMDPNQPQGATVPQMTPEQFTQMLQAAVKSAQPAPQPQQQQLSEAQMRQMLGVFDFDPNWEMAIFGEQASPQTRSQAFMAMLNAAVTQAVQMSRVQTLNEMNQFYQGIAPNLEMAAHLDNRFLFEDIYQGHEGLKQYDPVIRHMMEGFSKNQDFPQERSKRPDYIRQQMVNIIKQTQPDFDPTKGAVPQGQQMQQPQVRQPAPQQPARYHNSPPANPTGSVGSSSQPRQAAQSLSAGGGGGVPSGTSSPPSRPSGGFHLSVPRGGNGS